MIGSALPCAFVRRRGFFIKLLNFELRLVVLLIVLPCWAAFLSLRATLTAMCIAEFES